jgi:hypothetical protein
MLVLNRFLLNREYILMNVMKALASIVSDIPSIQRRESGGLFRSVMYIARVLSPSILIFQRSHQAAIEFRPRRKLLCSALIGYAADRSKTGTRSKTTLWEVPTRTQMAVRLSVLRTGCALLPRNIIFLLLVLISVTG